MSNNNMIGLDILNLVGGRVNIPKVNFTDYCGIMIAPPKFGKTTLASLYPNAIIVAFEKGYNAQVANVIDAPRWDDFIAFVDKLEKNRKVIGDNIKTIVLDTVNEAHEKSADYTLRYLSKVDQKKYTKYSDVPYGGFYTEWDKQFKLQIQRLIDLGFMPFYLTHNKTKTIKPKNGEAYDIYVSTMSERCEKIVYPAVDYIIHGERRKVTDEMGNTTLKRVLIVQGNEETEAGSRVAIKDNIVFDNEEEAITKFQAQFRANIEEKIRKAGITDDIDEIAKRQDKEKEEKVSEYLATQSEPTNAELVEKIKTLFVQADDVKKGNMTKFMGENGIGSLQNPDEISLENLKTIVAILSK